MKKILIFLVCTIITLPLFSQKKKVQSNNHSTGKVVIKSDFYINPESLTKEVPQTITEQEQKKFITVFVDGKPLKVQSLEDSCTYGLRAIQHNNKLGFIDKKSKIIIPLIYDSSRGFGAYNKRSLLAFIKNGKMGVIDRYNNVVVPFVFESVYARGEHTGDMENNEKVFETKLEGQIGYYDVFGNQIIAPKGGYHMVLYPSYNHWKRYYDLHYGKENKILDYKLKDVIPFEFDSFKNFDGDNFLVTLNKKNRLYNALHKKASDDYYNEIKIVNEGFVVTKGNEVGVLGRDLSVLLPVKYSKVSPIYNRSSLFMAETKNKKIGIFDTYSNQFLVDTLYNALRDVIIDNEYSTDFLYYIAQLGNKWGSLRRGKVDLPFEYDSINVVKGQNNCIVLYKAGVTGYFYVSNRQFSKTLKKEEIAWKNQYQSVELRGGKMYEVSKDSGHGFVDENGKIIVPCEFNKIYCQSQAFRLYRVYKQNLEGVYDGEQGIIGIPPIYDDLEEVYGNVNAFFATKGTKKTLFIDFKEIMSVEKDKEMSMGGIGLVIVRVNGKYGVYDVNSKKFMIEPKFESLQSVSDGCIYSENGKYGVLKKDLLSKMIPNDYDLIEQEKYFYYNVYKNGKKGIIENSSGEIIIPVEYDSIVVHNNHFITFSKNGKWGIKNVINPTVETPPIYNNIEILDYNLYLIDGKKYKFLKDKMIEVNDSN